MTGNQADSPFLKLSVGIRDIIYEHLLPDNDEILIGSGECFSLRRDGNRCYPATLAVNRQINAEAFRVMYAGPCIVTVSESCLDFSIYHHLKYRNGVKPGGPLGITHEIPFFFPFHKLKALRIRILPTRETERAGLPWAMYEDNFSELREALGAIAVKGLPLKKLILDASEPYGYKPTVDDSNHQADISNLFSSLGYHIGIAESCEISLPPWAKMSPRTIRMAKGWGRTTLYRRHLKVDSCVETVTEALRTCPMISVGEGDGDGGGEPIVLVKESGCEHSQEYKSDCSTVETRFTSL